MKRVASYAVKKGNPGSWRLPGAGGCVAMAGKKFTARTFYPKHHKLDLLHVVVLGVSGEPGGMDKRISVSAEHSTTFQRRRTTSPCVTLRTYDCWFWRSQFSFSAWYDTIKIFTADESACFKRGGGGGDHVVQYRLCRGVSRL